MTARTTQTEWEDLTETIIFELLGAVSAIEETLPVEYPGPKLFNAMRDYLERLKALNHGLPVGE